MRALSSSRWAGGQLRPRPLRPDGPLAAWVEGLSGNARPTQGGSVRPTFRGLSVPEAELLLQGLLLINVRQLLEGWPPISPALHDGRLRYIRSDPDEQWRTIRDIWQKGGGDCEDLATASAAEVCVATGQLPRIVAGAHPVIYRVRPGLSHVVTELAGGHRIDPSLTGGMGKE